MSRRFEMNLLAFVFIFNLFSYLSCQLSCNIHRTCGTCIGNAAEKCVWCSEDKKIELRCQPESYNETHTNWCTNDNIISSVTTNNTKQNNEFSSTVQLRPQEINFKARPGEDVYFNISYKPATDFPLDVYFLMDYTYTMISHRKALENQLLVIYESLKNLTNNVRLGVGSFVEKPALPYSDIYHDTTTLPAYVFKNHLSLTDDTTTFKRQVKGSEFGSNYDDAEAGLDALMQVMKCTRKLGWRKQTRRIIVLATDNTYHSAGDGKMVGAVKPNNMRCHLNLKEDEYKAEYSLKYDYPSVSQINKVAKDGSFLIIFAILPKVKPVYEALSKQIPGSRYAMLLEKDSNIMEIIQEAYKESVRTIEISHDASSSFQITIDQDCTSKLEKNCQSTPDKPIVDIPVTIRSKECSQAGEPSTIQFRPKNGIDDKLIVTFIGDCQCDCERTSSSNTSREKCNKKGFIQCGACKCDKDWGGDTCEINCSDETSKILEKKCYPANSTSTTMGKCHDHGTCECGKCLCTDGFTGELCEYDPNSCDTGNNGRICSGEGRGTCRFGECYCEDVWSGKACDCIKEEQSLKQCTGPFSKKACSGNGDCKCGKCICKKRNLNEMYSGAFCDSCEECAVERCRELEDYAKCNHNKTKVICDGKFNLTTDININVIVANKSKLVEMDEWTTGTQCRTELSDGTFLLFKYNADTSNSIFQNGDNSESAKMLLMIQREIEIPPKVDLMVVASVIVAILVIGLLTIVFWKVLIDWYDKREYNKFCSEAEAQGYNVNKNPLYQPPTQLFINPVCDENIN